MEDLDAIFVPIGGGGLIAGIAVYVKALKPSVKIIGVEPTGANCMAQSLQVGRRVTLSKVDAFADGVAVKSVGMVCLSSLTLHPALPSMPQGNASSAAVPSGTERRPCQHGCSVVAVRRSLAVLREGAALCHAATCAAHRQVTRQTGYCTGRHTVNA